MKTMTNEQLETELSEATTLGRVHGEKTASWFFDGNTSQETYERVHKGLQDGDPVIMDSLPSSPLSGEWADQMTPRRLLMELGWNEESVSAEQQDEICETYEQSFNDAVQREVERIANYHLQP